MEPRKSYRRIGTPDLPVASYPISAGIDMHYYSHYHKEVEITLVLTGTETMQIGSARNTFSEGDIYIIPPNTVHSRLAFSTNAAIRSVVFSPTAVSLTPEHFFQQEFVTPLVEERLILPSILTKEHPAYDTICHQIHTLGKYRIYKKDFKIGRFSAIMNICMALMPYCQVLEGEKPLPDPGNETVMLCMRYVHNHYFKKITLKVLAEKCHLHPNYLCAVFKAYTGQTIFEYINHYRIEIAMELLQKEDLPISRIAELAGFRSESLFYQKFREHTGMTPNAYSKTEKNKLRLKSRRREFPE